MQQKDFMYFGQKIMKIVLKSGPRCKKNQKVAKSCGFSADFMYFRQKLMKIALKTAPKCKIFQKLRQVAVFPESCGIFQKVPKVAEKLRRNLSASLPIAYLVQDQ